MINSPSIISSESTSLPSASIRTFNFRPSTISAEIPLIEEGPAVLEYIGFDAPTSNEIYQRYAARPWPDDCPDSLLDYAYGQVNQLNSTRYATLPIEEAMRRVGINAQFEPPLPIQTLPTFSTLKISFFGRRDPLKRHAHQTAHREKKRVSLEGVFNPQTVATVTAAINMTTKDFNLPAAHVAMCEGDPPALPNHVVLYNGKAFAELQTTRSIIRDDGSVDMIPLRSSVGGDFNATELAYYWTPEKDIAERYRTWAALRNPSNDTCILQIQVSRTFLDNMASEEIWFSDYRDHWKEFVWCCRMTEEPPRHLEYLLNAELIRGHICTGHTNAIFPLQRVENISRDNLLRCRSTGLPASQWVFKLSTGSRLATEIRGKVHFNIFAAIK
ncbi:hypothetical protein P170DRAFT_425213 [Aspergillus steynii IBT 23096]|uniref:Uncharacterized protein n=1 Tax=Aspergillus steynii IBT 23096 TaxID=1392250 RepID=A0A2I2GDI4_9EURO|nr:uncharacterized protein P170DRAFT_425213 [Aspergillus steynii IBT 23096]PLB50920.1 hypothetical protein P170DRAFT_425213 [Aspergillus steynii IBT 23096]